MEAIHSSRARSGIYFQLGDEMESLMAENQDNENSFTALLGLPANEAVNLLHQPESSKSEAEERPTNQTLGIPFNLSSTFPANAALFQRAARFSIFAGSKESPETASSDPSNCSNDSHKLVTVKCEATDSDSNLNSTAPIFTAIQKEKRTNKRKEGGTNKVKGTTKRNKSGDEANSNTKPLERTGDQDCGGVPEKLPYVHVRARRGQATDSHSLAERARREKINKRMKLLQELVPGCNKISGTALVLDEIINHVQSLQHQVEILSMRLAAVNPGIGFSCENFLSQDQSCLTATNGVNIEAEQLMWAELQVNGLRRQNHQHQHLWQLDACGPDSVVPSAWERDHSLGFIAPDTSVPGFDPAS